MNRAGQVSLLYVGGMGRSGSTLLERLLGQLPGACNLGEVIWLWDRGVRQNQRCGCGEPFLDCPFWTEVGARAFGGWDRVDVDHIETLARAVDDVKHAPRMLLPSSGHTFDRLMHEYTGYYSRIYRAAAEVAGASIIVDSSKQTSLAYALSHEPTVDLKLLHLVRDPRAVAHSWGRLVRRPEISDEVIYMPRMNAAYVAVLWCGHNVLLHLLRLRSVPTKTATYEGFVGDPVRMLSAIAEFAALPQGQSDLPFLEHRTATLRPTHSVAGNPMRFQTGQIEIRRDERWRREMSKGSRLLVSALAMPTAFVLGYPPWSRETSPDTSRSSPSAASSVDMSSPPAEVACWPSVTAVIPTHRRPEMVRAAIASILGQDYSGELDIVVVHDGEQPDLSLTEQFGPRVEVIANERTPGLSGARNHGILHARGELVAFCDDDDLWLPGKLSRQVARMLQSPQAVMASTAMLVDFQGTESERLAATDTVTYDDLLMSRMAMLHSSSFLLRRDWMLDGHLLREDLPGSMGEDWDVLLQAAGTAPIAHLDEPLVRVLWGSTSYFSRDWRMRLAANTWFLQEYPDLLRSGVGMARLAGQNAFFAAASGDRLEALRWMTRSLRVRPTEPRAWLTLPVVAVPRLGRVVMAALHRRGRGI